MHTQVKNYKKKAYFCGNTVEIYEYENAVFTGHTGKRPGPGRVKLAPDQDGERANNSITRSRQTLRRLVNSNPDLDKFLTLTFAENKTNVKEANRLFKAFMTEFRRRSGLNFRYIAVIEFQKRGAVHYHLVMDTPFIDQAWLARLWGHGFIKMKHIDSHRNMGGYISKYLNKKRFDKRLFSKKAFWSSRNVKRPIALLDKRIDLHIGLYYNGTIEKCSFTFTAPKGVTKYSFHELCLDQLPIT